MLFLAITSEIQRGGRGGHSLNTAALISAALLYIITIKDALSRPCFTVCLCEREIVAGADVTFQNLVEKKRKKNVGHSFFLCLFTTMKTDFSSR